MAELRRAREVVRRGRAGGRFLATLPRSGTNWLVAMVESGINLAHGLDGDYDLVDDYFVSGDPGWRPRGNRHCWQNSLRGVVHAARTTTGRVQEPVILGGHFPITHGTADLGASGRPVVLVRDPLASVESLIHKVERSGSPAAHQQALALASGYADYYEYWVDRSSQRGDDVLILRFEDLVDDPADGLRKVSSHWRLDLAAEVAAEAAELCRRGRMAEKAAADPSNVRVTIDEPVTDPDLLDELRGLLRRRLDHPFGYRLDEI